jgi:hypothetical protein
VYLGQISIYVPDLFLSGAVPVFSGCKKKKKKKKKNQVIFVYFYFLESKGYTEKPCKRVSDPIIDGCEPPCGCWELDSGPLEEQVASALNR